MTFKNLPVSYIIDIVSHNVCFDREAVIDIHRDAQINDKNVQSDRVT